MSPRNGAVGLVGCGRGLKEAAPLAFEATPPIQGPGGELTFYVASRIDPAAELSINSVSKKAPAMARTFTCYLHKPGVLTPELRVVACRSENELPDAILAQLETWGAFEKIDVYDDADKPMFSFTSGPNPTH